MSLKGKMINEIEIKSDGDVFHELHRYNPHGLSNICGDKKHGCDLHEGQWGHVGSIIKWSFTHEGKKKIAIEKIVAIDEEEKLIRFKKIGGDIMDLYKIFNATCHVEAHGESNLVTWTFKYEKMNEDVPYPTTSMDLVLQVTKGIETHHLK